MNTKFSTFNRLNKVYKSSPEISFNSSSKIVIFSDCHRGDGSWVDDFNYNQTLYYAAIKHYHLSGFTYIDLGDSDELWKNKKVFDITSTYTDIFRLLHEFYQEGRYHMIYGNHDIEKRYPEFIKKHLETYYDSYNDTNEPLFKGIQVHEGLILKHSEIGLNFLLVHGHQGDILSDICWRIGRFLARYVWKRLELFGSKNPTSAAKNFTKKKKVERKIIEWVTANNQPVIAGHTHRSSCPIDGEKPYFNDGSCVHPNCITCLEIENDEIILVKWVVKTREDRIVYVDRVPISYPREIQNIADSLKS